MLDFFIQEEIGQLMLQLIFALVIVLLIIRSKGIYESKHNQDSNYLSGLIHEIKKPKHIAWIVISLPFLYTVKTLLSIYWIHDFRDLFFQRVWDIDYIWANPSIDDFLYVPLIAIYFIIYFPFNGLILQNKFDEKNI